MPNLNYTIHLTYESDPRSITAHVIHESIHITTHEYPNQRLKERASLELFLLWLTDVTNSLFYHNQFEDLDIQYTTSSSLIHELYGEAIDRFISVIKNTQSLIKKYKAIFTKTKDFDSKLFYNIDHFPLFEEMFQEASNMFPQEIFYLNCSSGWNKETRSWENGPKKNSLTLEELIDYICINKIGHIYTVNMYYLNQLMDDNSFFALPFFYALNIEWISIDYDLYENKNGEGLSQRDAFNCPSFRRFSFWPHALKPLDQNHTHKNVIYFSPNKKIEENTSLFQLKSDYNTLVISHSRLSNIISNLSNILFFLEHTDPHQPYIDFQMLYYSLNHLIISEKNLTHVEKVVRFSYLTNLYFDVLSFLKYDVIQGLLDQQIPTQIFGDNHWELIFPTTYQKSYLSEKNISEMLQSRVYLYLLMNQNYSYFESNLVVSRAIQQSTPYLCFTSAVTTPDLDGLRKLEYSNRDELIKKIPIINDLINTSEYKSSLKTFCAKSASCRHEMNHMMTQPSLKENPIFKQIYQSHESIFIQKLKDYFKNNHERIFYLYDEVYSGNSKNFNVTSSRYSKEEFLKKIILFYKN